MFKFRSDHSILPKIIFALFKYLIINNNLMMYIVKYNFFYKKQICKTVKINIYFYNGNSQYKMWKDDNGYHKYAFRRNTIDGNI